jgi:hypothetical protein
MSPAIEKLDVEIAALQAEVARIAQLPRTIAERFAEAEGELRSAAALYQSHGLKISAAHPGETAHLQRQALIGLCMVVGADKILNAERARIEQHGEGLTSVDKTRKLDELHRQILQVAARRELALRQVDGDGEFLPRPTHPEMAIFQRREVERLAAAR